MSKCSLRFFYSKMFDFDTSKQLGICIDYLHIPYLCGQKTLFRLLNLKVPLCKNRKHAVDIWHRIN